MSQNPFGPCPDALAAVQGTHSHQPHVWTGANPRSGATGTWRCPGVAADPLGTGPHGERVQQCPAAAAHAHAHAAHGWHDIATTPGVNRWCPGYAPHSGNEHIAGHHGAEATRHVTALLEAVDRLTRERDTLARANEALQRGAEQLQRELSDEIRRTGDATEEIGRLRASISERNERHRRELADAETERGRFERSARHHQAETARLRAALDAIDAAFAKFDVVSAQHVQVQPGFFTDLRKVISDVLAETPYGSGETPPQAAEPPAPVPEAGPTDSEPAKRHTELNGYRVRVDVSDTSGAIPDGFVWWCSCDAQPDRTEYATWDRAAEIASRHLRYWHDGDPAHCYCGRPATKRCPEAGSLACERPICDQHTLCQIHGGRR